MIDSDDQDLLKFVEEIRGATLGDPFYLQALRDFAAGLGVEEPEEAEEKEKV